jgi:hypothetical protein
VSKVSLSTAKADVVAQIHEKAGFGYQDKKFWQVTILKPKQLSSILAKDEFLQLESPDERSELAAAIRDELTGRGMKKKGWERKWRNSAREDVAPVLDAYVKSAPDTLLTQVEQAVARYLTEKGFDEAAVLHVLRSDSAQALPPGHRQQLIAHINKQSALSFSLEARRALSDYGLNGRNEAVLNRLEQMRGSLSQAVDYPLDELEDLYTELRVVFALSIVENQDALLEAITGLAETLNSPAVLRRFGLNEGAKIKGPWSLIEELKAQQEAAKAQEAAAETTPDSKDMGWSVTSA